MLGIGGDYIAGAYTCAKYFQGLDLPANRAFVAAFKAMWGAESVIGDVTATPMSAPGCGSWRWRRRAASTSPASSPPPPASSSPTRRPVRTRIHENHHLWTRTRVGRARRDGQFDVVHETRDLIEPNPFPDGFREIAA
ncbi:transporter substrate-binding protein [Azospirillum agricola]|uniref:transporter substrate-binding protein n=1 Tax=Azospirillum agricola TaxID=1720247 RepID=UPI000A0F2EC6|nr:transporter substrate-binding protein [Azospirillum agricola]SMH63065.1 substrate-binding protein domain-containing protein [Azospirillum lipoferum]